MKARVIFLLDRSGSMQYILDDTIGGHNAYVEELQKGPEADNITFTRVQFDSNGIDTEFSDCPIKSVPALSKENFKPNGMTPLLEAAAKTIKAAAKKEWDGKTIFIILTDGKENSSKIKYTTQYLADLISKYKKEGWEFVFLGAGIDAYEQANGIGIPSHNTMSYDSKDTGATMSSYAGMARNTQEFVSGKSRNMRFTPDQKLEAKDAYAGQAPDDGIDAVVLPTFEDFGDDGKTNASHGSTSAPSMPDEEDHLTVEL